MTEEKEKINKVRRRGKEKKNKEKQKKRTREGVGIYRSERSVSGQWRRGVCV